MFLCSVGVVSVCGCGLFGHVVCVGMGCVNVCGLCMCVCVVYVWVWLQQEARRGLELQGLQTHDVPWPQERALLQQEVRLFRHHTVILYMKLRWILTHWRLGRRAEAGEEGAHEEVRANMADYTLHKAGVGNCTGAQPE